MTFDEAIKILDAQLANARSGLEGANASGLSFTQSYWEGCVASLVSLRDALTKETVDTTGASQ